MCDIFGPRKPKAAPPAPPPADPATPNVKQAAARPNDDDRRNLRIRRTRSPAQNALTISGGAGVTTPS